MGKKGQRENGRRRRSRLKTGSGQGLSDRGLQAAADAGLKSLRRRRRRLELVAGGARTTNPQLQMRLDLLSELGKRNDIRGFVRVFVPHDLTQEDTNYFAGELEGDETRWKQLVEEVTLMRTGRASPKSSGTR